MIKVRDYNEDEKMISLISKDYRLLQVLSRFGIPLGFNEKSVKEVCESNGVDWQTFLTIVNFLNDENSFIYGKSPLSFPSLLHYLKQSHIYFLDFFLPSIRRKLLNGITLKDSDVSFLIIKLFDEYVESIKEHMEEEENQLFCKVNDKMTSREISAKEIPFYSHHHKEVGSKLRELKNIIIKYCPSQANANILNDALYDIYRFEEELESHCKIEDYFLLPMLES